MGLRPRGIQQVPAGMGGRGRTKDAGPCSSKGRSRTNKVSSGAGGREAVSPHGPEPLSQVSTGREVAHTHLSQGG